MTQCTMACSTSFATVILQELHELKEFQVDTPQNKTTLANIKLLLNLEGLEKNSFENVCSTIQLKVSFIF